MLASFIITHASAIYIPHSSDKTNTRPDDTKKGDLIYIPHSSDKTHIIPHKGDWELFIYIPHSSDKTWVTEGILLCEKCNLHST